MHTPHAEDLAASGITEPTRQLHKIRDVPPDMVDGLLGFRAPRLRSAYIIPYPDPLGGWMDHVKLKVFSDAGGADVRADHVEEHRERWRYNGGQRKYLVRRESSPRLYFPIPTMARALEGAEPLWICEGPKKALAVMQLGLPAIAVESAWSWHVKGTRALLPDFNMIALEGRAMKVVPDSDISTTPQIAHAYLGLAQALEHRGARVQIVMLPQQEALAS
jgi:hypothetical protein